MRPIFWILLLALLLRLWGIDYGFPLFLINDETPHVYGALKMIELKTLIPAWHEDEFKKVLYYPPLLSYFFLLVLSPVIGVHYLLSGAPPLTDYKLTLALDPSFIWVAARVWTALIGIADIFVIYLLTRRLFQSERAGVFAAFFLGLSFWHLQLSHNARHWLPAAFLLSIVWYLSLRIWEGGVLRKHYATAGLVAGLAAGGVNTAAAVGLIPPILIGFLGGGAGRLWLRLKGREVLILLASFSAAAALFLALYPFGLTRAEGATSAGTDIGARFALLGGKSIPGWLDFVGEYITALWKFEAPLFLAALLGMTLLFYGRRKERIWALAATGYTIIFFTLLYLFDDFTSRGLIFVLPIFAVFAGYATDYIWKKVRNMEIKKSSPKFSHFLIFLASFFFFLLLFGWQIAVDLRYQTLLARKDTRLVARDWIFENIPAGARVLMDSQYLRLPATKEAIGEVIAVDPRSLRAADRALLALPEERQPKPAYHLLNLNLIAPAILEELLTSPTFLAKGKFDYIVVEYAHQEAIQSGIERLFPSATLLKRFTPWRTPRPIAYDGSGKIDGISITKLFQLERFGLFVEIYKLL